MFFGYKVVNKELMWGEAKEKKSLEDHGFTEISADEYQVIATILEKMEPEYTGYLWKDGELSEYSGDNKKELEDAGCLCITEKYDEAKVKLARILGRNAFLKRTDPGDYGDAWHIFSYVYFSKIQSGVIREGKDCVLHVLSRSKEVLINEGIEDIKEYTQHNSWEDEDVLYVLELQDENL